MREGQKGMCVMVCCAQFFFEHFCAQFLWKRQCATAHKPVCVGLTCKGEGGKCQNKKRL